MVVYRECMGHGPFPFSRLVIRRSLDGGNNWSDRRILTETVVSASAFEKSRPWLSADSIDGYQQTKARLTESWQTGASINCPRLITLQDGSLFLVADLSLAGSQWVNKVWRSADEGATWSAGADLKVSQQGIVPQLNQLRDGRMLLSLNIPEPGKDDEYMTGIFFSSDRGETWTKPVYLPKHAGDLEPDEVGYVELQDGTLVGFGRNYSLEKQHRPSTGLKVISKDGGQTWRGPFETWMLGLEGRPKPGLLASGEVCVTYRMDSPNEMLAMHVMTQAAAGLERTGDLVAREPVPEDIADQIARQKGEPRPWYMTSYYPGRTVILDIDRSVHRDSGYSGWVQLPEGDIFVVDYINDDAPLAQIRGYLVRRSDYILFPDGDLPWLHPSGQPFREITAGLARQQMEKNRNRSRVQGK